MTVCRLLLNPWGYNLQVSIGSRNGLAPFSAKLLMYTSDRYPSDGCAVGWISVRRRPELLCYYHRIWIGLYVT